MSMTYAPMNSARRYLEGSIEATQNALSARRSVSRLLGRQQSNCTTSQSVIGFVLHGLTWISHGKAMS